MKGKQVVGTKCTQGNEINVLRSGAGYYIGCMTFDEEMGFDVPQCRLTTLYAKDKESALELELDRLDASEVQFCCAYRGCMLSE